jgi:glycosyltransferase involved in cell wall biosynthesis
VPWHILGAMRVLHVGSGFRPWRHGGLVAYTEDLMDEQVRRGHGVSYFFSGRQYPLVSGPRLRRWRQRGVEMLEVVNSPLYDHGRQPALEIGEPRVERTLGRALRATRPDVVHVHEFAGLPFSILDVIDDAGLPSIVTLQDYFPICSTFRLLDAAGRVCQRREIGADCVATTAADPRPAGLMVAVTLASHLRALPPVRLLNSGRIDGWLTRASHAVARVEAARRADAGQAARDGADMGALFQRRREVNVERLNRADCVIAMSHRVAEIYARLGVRQPRTVHLTLAHIERLRPRPVEPPGRPLTLATLAGFESESKGALLLIEAMRLIARRTAPGSVRLLVLGQIAHRFRTASHGVPGIELGRPFRPDELDAILDAVDVGLMPSIWEEAYGYAGVEFLAKGIPVIANAIGGMRDYVREGETGWLNRSCSAEELADIVVDIAARPAQVADLSARIVAGRDLIVKPLARHADEMDAIYAEAAAARAG